MIFKILTKSSVLKLELHSGSANLRLAHSNLSSNIWNRYITEFVFSYFRMLSNNVLIFIAGQKTLTKKIDKPDIRPDIRIKLKLSVLLKNDSIHAPTKFRSNLFINVAKTDIRLNIRPDNQINYGRIVTKIIFLLNDHILTIHTKFCAILMISVVKPNIRPDIRPDIRIKFLLSQIL